MNYDVQLAALLRIAVSLTLLVGVLLMWRRQRLDRLRQDLFILRDQVFDIAAAGGIPFDHPAYGTVRAFFNGLIRFGHRLTLSIMVVLVIEFRRHPELAVDPDERLKKQMADLAPDVQRAIMASVGAARRRALKHIFTGAPILWVLALALVLCAIALGSYSAAKKRLVEKAVRSPGMQAIELEANVLGAELSLA
jgi:hypothetical protein